MCQPSTKDFSFIILVQDFLSLALVTFWTRSFFVCEGLSYAASLASIHLIPAAPKCNNQKHLQTLPNTLWKEDCPCLRTTAMINAHSKLVKQTL